MTDITTVKTERNILFPIVLALVAGVATGVLWCYANPIQLVPGVIQWRIFAFLPPLVGILFGFRSGFICGYVGSLGLVAAGRHLHPGPHADRRRHHGRADRRRARPAVRPGP